MVIRIYNWNDKKLIMIYNNVEITIVIDEYIRINNHILLNFNHHFMSEISHKLHNIELLDLYIENRMIKGFNYQLKDGSRKNECKRS